MKRLLKTALALVVAGGGLIASGSAFAAFPAPYCVRGYSTGVEPITNVAIDGINNPSSATIGGTADEDYTAIIGQLAPGGAYPITVQGNNDGPYTAGVAVYIDWDHNGTFDPAESYFVGSLVGSTGADGKTATATITVPASATLGQTRMRVAKQYTSTAPGLSTTLACGTTGFGQAEDYTVNIDVNAPVPPSLGMAFAPTNGAVGASSTLTLTLGNATASANALSADFTNTFPAGLAVAATPAAATTCTAGTVSTTANSVTLANGASIPAGGCTVKVDVSAASAGIYVNTIAAGALSTASGGAPGATATYQATQAGVATYSTGFETPTYVVGNLASQGGWGRSGGAAADLQISTVNPGAGLQHLRSTWATAGSGTVAAISGIQPVGTTTYAIASAKLAINQNAAANGTEWDFTPQDPAAGFITTRVRFLRPTAGVNKIQVLDPNGGGPGVSGFVDTGAFWTAGAYFDLKVIANRSAQSSEICINGASIFTVNGFAKNIANIAITGTKGTGTNGNTLDVDNVVIDNSNIGTCNGLPAPHTVTPSVGTPSGTITPATAQTVNDGATTSFTLAADAGFHVDTVGGTCGGTLAGLVFTTAAVTADCTVIANFVADAPTPSLSKAFTPASVAVNVNSVATITLTNPLATPATLTASLTDVLPAGLDVVSATTSCGIILSRPQTPNASVGLPAGVAIPANGSCTLDITVRSATPGSYVNTLAAGALQTDAGNNVAAASATLTVTPAVVLGPIANITPATLSMTVPQNGSGTATMNIANTGDAALTYALTESAAGALPIAQSITRPAKARGDVSMMGSRSHKASTDSVSRPNPVPSAVVIDQGFDDITTLTDWLQVNNSSPAGTSNWFQGNANVFPAFDGATTAYIGANFNNTSGAGMISNWLVTPLVTFNSGSNMSFYTRTANGATFADRLQVRLCTTAPCTNVGTSATDVGDFGTLLLDINPNELAGPDPTGVNGYPDVWTQFTISAGMPSTGSGRIAFRYYVTDGGPSGAGSDFIGIDRVVVDNGGTPPPVGCTNPSDIPWLSETPTSGSVAAGANADVTVSANPGAMAAGTYTANVCVATNDPAHALVTVPVSLTVTSVITTYTVTPSVGTPSGTISPATVQTVNSGATPSFTLTPDAGFHIDTVGGTCGGTLTGNVYKTAAVTANCTVIANFAAGAAFPAPYCPVLFPSAVEPITRVKFTGIDNVSSATVGGSPALENFLSVTGGNVVAGLTYSMAVEGNTDGGFTTQVKAYIDWNQNGVFDANEAYVIGAIVNSTGTDGIQAVANIMVPTTALGGPTRMRVIKKFGSTANPDACNTTGYGQAEDYTLNVTAETGVPVASVTPGAFDFTVAQGSTGNDTMVIGNSGTATLTYNITRALAARHADAAAAAQKVKVAFDPFIAANDARKAALSGEVPMPQALDLLTATAGFPPMAKAILASDPACATTVAGMIAHDHGGVPQNGYGWNASAGAVTRFADKFTPTSYPGTFNTVCLSLLTNAGLTSVPVKVVVFADDGAGGAPGTQLGSVDVTANNIGTGLVESYQAFDISSMNLSIASGSVYIGVQWDATSITGMFLGADETSATSAGGYSYTAASAAWGSITTAHAAYKAMYIRAVEGPAGPPGTGCDAPSNVPWLTVNPATGNVSPASSANIALTIDPGTLAVGNYAGLICVNTNDLVTPRFVVPVTLEVTPAPPVDLIFKDGFDGSGGAGGNIYDSGVLSIDVPANIDGVYLNWVDGSTCTDGSCGGNFNPYATGTPNTIHFFWPSGTPAVEGGVGSAATTQYSILTSGATIGPASEFINLAGNPPADMSNWAAGVDGFLGFKFACTGPAAGICYGYANIKTTAPNGFPTTIKHYWYDTTGVAITIP